MDKTHSHEELIQPGCEGKKFLAGRAHGIAKKLWSGRLTRTI